MRRCRPDHQLVLVALGLGLDSLGEQGLRRLDRREDDRRGLVGQGVAGCRMSQLACGPDVARHDLLGRLLVLAAHREDVGQAFICFLGRVVDRPLAHERARDHSEEADLSHVGVGERLEDQSGHRSVRLRFSHLTVYGFDWRRDRAVRGPL